MGWTSAIANRIIVFVLGLIAVLYAIFPGKLYSIEWIFAALLIVVILISSIGHLSKSWLNINGSRYIRRLFWMSFIIRLIVMLILLAISYNVWNMFYIVGARDEQVYYRVASEATAIWHYNKISDAYLHIFTSYKNEISDTGYSTFLMIPMLILGQSPVLIKIFLCFMGSIIVIRGYKLAGMLIEEPAARLAGIFLALYPISWFYSIIMLKENIMVLMIIEALILMVKIQRSFRILNMLKVVVIIFLLFFFRSALSILLLTVLMVSFVMQQKKKYVLVNVLLAAIIIIIYINFLKSTGRYDEYYNQYTNVNEFTQERLTYMEKINPFVAMVGSPVFAVLSYISPFPSVVTVPNAQGLPHSEYYYNVAGNIFWIVLAFFSFYGLYYSLRYKRQEMAVLLAFVIGYQFVLLKAMMFTSVRFSYPAKPFLLILAAYGIYKMKSKKWYPVYLVVALVLIVGWNYVRLKGRG